MHSIYKTSVNHEIFIDYINYVGANKIRSISQRLLGLMQRFRDKEKIIKKFKIITKKGRYVDL